MRGSRYVLFLMLIFVQENINAQLYCLNYTSKDGLPNDYVTYAQEDSKGYMWIGTASGLVLFDGVNFIKKGWQGNGDIPKEVYVREILFESEQSIWISTERNGIYHHNSKTEKWTNFSSEKIGNQYIPAYEIYDIELAGNKLLFGCSNCGLSYINTRTLTPKLSNKIDTEAIKKYRSNNLDNSFLFATKSSLFSATFTKESFTVDTLFYRYKGINIFDIFLSKDSQIYVIDYEKGISIFDQNSKTIEPTNPIEFGDHWKYQIIDGNDQAKWVLLPNIGIAKQKETNHKWELFTSKPYDSNGLPKAYYTHIHKSKSNTLWISSSKGLTCIHPDYQGFKEVPSIAPHKEYLLDVHFDPITSKYICSYASPGDRIKFYDKDFHLLNSINHLPGDTRIHSIFELVPFQNGYLGLGNILYYIHPEIETISAAQLPNFPTNRSPYGAFIDGDDLWVYLSGNEVIQYSITENKVKQTIPLPRLGEKPYPFYIINDFTDFGTYIAISAQSLFVLISKQTGETHYFRLNTMTSQMEIEDQHPKNQNTFNQATYLGNKEFLLVTKTNGLYKCRIEEDTMHIRITKSLSKDELYSPVELVKNNNNIWIATDNGLAIASNDLKLVKKITSSQGLTNSKLVQGVSLVENTLILNGETGIILGNPQILGKEMDAIPVDFVSAKLGNEDLIRSVENVFTYTNNNLNIAVAIPVYGNRNAYSYRYRLLNHTDEWSIQESKINTIHYEKLAPGSYTFEIQSIVDNQHGPIQTIFFRISPPYWATWWFKFIIGLGICSVLYFIYSYRIKTKLNHERLNTQLAELKNEALRAQLNPHFIFNALNSIRSMILLDKKEESIEYLGHFSSMVRDVLNYSKEKNIPLSKEIEFNVNYIQIEQLRFSQKFTYEIQVQDNVDVGLIKVPAMVLQPFIENAIWHGLLHKEGDAKLSIYISILSNLLHIKIEDNGVGREAARKIKSNSKSKTRKGYGELLSSQIVHSLGVEAKIEIEDKTSNGHPSGTLVTIKIPIVYD
ncbi:MAG: histidine kinase [Saprospiraceae bacterium]|nr:histidine kinase [Saprospiraceae bacterium]